MSEDILARARFRHRVPVRFRDLDSMGHAHHSLPLVYYEEARAQYWREVAGRTDTVDYIMATVTVRLHARIYWPALLEVALRTTRIGTKSFVIEFAIVGEDGTLLSSGETTQVMYDFESGRSVIVPDEVRARIEAYEGFRTGSS